MLPKSWLFIVEWMIFFGLWFSSGAQANWACIQSLQQPPSGFPLSIGRIYVEGEARANRLFFLTASEYNESLENDSLPLDSILILDELPLGEDLPLVAGIIISKELALEATHVQVLAEKMEIPLVFSESAFLSDALRELANNNRSFNLKCQQGNCSLAGFQTPQPAGEKMISVLPLNENRTQRTLFTRYDLLDLSPRELSGDKYYSLMEFKRAFPDWVVDISSLSSGYYEYFLDNYESDGSLLRLRHYQLGRILKEANQINDEEKIKVALANFREAILKAMPYRPQKNIFQDVVSTLENYYGSSNGSYSLRSNNDVEDLLATGLYKSAIAKGLNVEEVAPGLRKIWASMFEYRAYAIRRYWGQKEDNLSMPVMVHPFIGNVLSHSVAIFKYKPESGVSLDINMVMGDSEKATNPSPQAQVMTLSVRQNKKGKGELIFDNSNQGSKLTRPMEKAILEFFNSVQNYVSNEFIYRNFTPTAVSLEFVVLKPRFFWNSPKVQVLQYKPGFNREIILSVLTGMLTREETDRRDAQYAKIQDSVAILEQNKAKKLDEVVPESLWAFYHKVKPRHKKHLRYALLMEDKVPFFIVWDSGIYHQEMKTKLARSKMKWLKSGYITLKTSGTVPVLVFTETTVIDETDRALLLPLSTQLFNTAFASAVRGNPELENILNVLKPKILFHTFEGGGTIYWPPNPP